MVARLRERVAAWPQAKRFIIHGDWHPPIEELIAATNGLPACVYGTPVTDTYKEVVDGFVRQTISREALVTARGPWVFSRDALHGGLSRVAGHELEITSLTAFCEAAGLRVRVLPRV